MRSPSVLICGLLLPFFVLSSASTGRTQTSSASTSTKPKTVTPRVERATWDERIETSMGISRDDFISMGLSKLSTEEYAKLLGWAVRREYQATETGKTAGKEEQKAISGVLPTYSCGPTFKEEVELLKIHLLITANDQNAPEMMSALRSRLRSISDIQIVYDAKDADLVIDVLSFEVKSGNGTIGYAASVTTFDSYTAKMGTTEWTLKAAKNHILQTGGRDVNPTIEEIVTSLDSRDFEEVRKEHASFKKYLFKK
jgi:hypothetical protein